MSLRIATAPAIEPVSLTEAKAHLHYDATDQNDRITALIAAARASCEAETNRSFLTQTWTMTLGGFPPGVIVIPKSPLQSITSIVYVDDNGETQTLDADQYQLDTISEPGRIAPARNCSWPSTDGETLNPVTITFVAGWTAAASVPEELQHAVLLLVGHWFDNLAAVTMEGTPKRLPFAVQMLLTHWALPVA